MHGLTHGSTLLVPIVLFAQNRQKCRVFLAEMRIPAEKLANFIPVFTCFSSFLPVFHPFKKNANTISVWFALASRDMGF